MNKNAIKRARIRSAGRADLIHGIIFVNKSMNVKLWPPNKPEPTV